MTGTDWPQTLVLVVAAAHIIDRHRHSTCPRCTGTGCPLLLQSRATIEQYRVLRGPLDRPSPNRSPDLNVACATRPTDRWPVVGTASPVPTVPGTTP